MARVWIHGIVRAVDSHAIDAQSCPRSRPERCHRIGVHEVPADGTIHEAHDAAGILVDLDPVTVGLEHRSLVTRGWPGCRVGDHPQTPGRDIAGQQPHVALVALDVHRLTPRLSQRVEYDHGASGARLAGCGQPEYAFVQEFLGSVVRRERIAGLGVPV
jgi:hypothetical protein